MGLWSWFVSMAESSLNKLGNDLTRNSVAANSTPHPIPPDGSRGVTQPSAMKTGPKTPVVELEKPTIVPKEVQDPTPTREGSAKKKKSRILVLPLQEYDAEDEEAGKRAC